MCLNPNVTGSVNTSFQISTSHPQFGPTVFLTATVYNTPAVSRNAPALGSNAKVNVSHSTNVQFKVTSGNPLYPGATLQKYQWRQEVGSQLPTVFEDGPATGEKNLSFNAAGEYTVYARMVDNHNVASAYVAIPVRAWNRPVVKDTPPASAIPANASEITQASKASWLANKYVGVKGSAVKLQADASLESNEAISKFLWDFDNNWAAVELEQPGNALATYTWDTPNLSGRIRTKAVTNYGIESNEKVFDLKIYDTVQANPGGPYNSRPNRSLTLKGSINTTSYPGATVVYQWKVQQQSSGALVNVTTKSDGSAENTWTVDGVYNAEFTATVTAQEGLTILGTGTTMVTIESGRPTAMPGGPYRGGIDGGNFTPIPFEGNPPDFVEAEDIGHIVAWEWSNSEVLNVNGALKGSAVKLSTGEIELTPAQFNINGQFEYSNLPLGDSWKVTGEREGQSATGWERQPCRGVAHHQIADRDRH